MIVINWQLFSVRNALMIGLFSVAGMYFTEWLIAHVDFDGKDSE